MSVSLVDGHIDSDAPRMTDNNEARCLIDIPADGNYIEILGQRIDVFDSFEAFCEYLKKYAELEEIVDRQKDYIELLELEKQTLKEAKEKAAATAMGVIKRQDAEIERLTADVKTMESVIKRSFVEAAGFDIDPLAEIKGEAVREFAERLKENLIEESYDDCQFFKVVGESEIDNLVKEMVGVESGN